MYCQGRIHGAFEKSVRPSCLLPQSQGIRGSLLASWDAKQAWAAHTYTQANTHALKKKINKSSRKENIRNPEADFHNSYLGSSVN